LSEDPNVFAGAFVDRSGERRKDPDWLAEALSDDETRFVPVWGDRCLVGGDPPGAVLLTNDEVADFASHDTTIFLGLFRNQPAFAVSIDRAIEAPFTDRGEFKDLRFLGTVLPPDEANLVAHARALAIWHDTTLYCPRCGSASQPEAGGNTRRCCNPECARELFPRTDPAIIVLVADGHRCVLGRQASWPEGRYSTIAGFVEPGESLEDAVRREVYEETNIRVGAVHYHSSQPWPFPSALMLGFIAEAASGDIRLNDGELEDARWFTRDELKSGEVGLPFRISIARRLVDHFINGG
jgi:NAD+ diphosphatase